ncbi:MAG: hypothetical protein RLZZ488_169 [Pseudomonadota bacterium]|jgi:tetratricopeptide (TPR) repeat protein
MGMLKYLGLFFVVGACTSTQPERSDLQDGAFLAASYNRERDELDATLRSVDESAGEGSLQNIVRKDFYLPPQQLRGLNKRAEAARLKLSQQSVADADSLRVLAIEAIVEGRPEQVQGFVSLAKSKRARRNLTGDDQLLLGIASFMLGDTLAAKRLLTEAAGSPSVSSIAKANMGLIAMRHGSFVEALEMFTQAESAEPKNSRYMHMVAESAHMARKHSRSVEVYRKIIARDPNDFLARYNLGLVYHYGLRKYAEARREFMFVMDHPRAPRDMKILSDGAFATARREEEGFQGIATTGFQ